jgi:hypothetical protein
MQQLITDALDLARRIEEMKITPDTMPLRQRRRLLYALANVRNVSSELEAYIEGHIEAQTKAKAPPPKTKVDVGDIPPWLRR